MAQDWDHLLYLHYRVDPAEIRSRVPEPLELDELEGTAWVSVIPLRLNHVHLRDVIPIPGTSEFTELNVRTYVSHQGIPGVFFLSIDASSRLASAVARSSFNLPYHPATMTFEEDDGEYHAVSRRDDAKAGFEARYRPTGQMLADSGEMLSSNGVTAIDPEPIMGYSQGSTSRCWPVRAAGVPPRIWPRL